MPIKIAKKATAGGQYNKTPIIPKKPSATDAPKPFIDKIVVTLSLNDQQAHATYMALFPQLEDPQLFLDAPNAKVGGYNLAKRLVLPSISETKKLPLLNARWLKEKKLVPRLRIEFVPVDVGPSGMAEIHAQLSGLIEDGWGAFANHGRVTRLDVAVDLTGLTMDSVHFQPKKIAHQKHWLSDGKLETIYIGKTTGNFTVIYDRKAKRSSMGQEWEAEGVRIERRLKSLNKSPSQLHRLQNPFEGTTLNITLPAPPEGEKQWQWMQFADSVKMRGLPAALALLPEDRKARYKKHLKQHKAPEWDTDAIWQGWKPMLDSQMIAKTDWQ